MSSASGTPARSLVRQAGPPPAYTSRPGLTNVTPAPSRRTGSAVVEALALRPGQVVLDVGCGTGLCCGPMRDKVGPDGAVIGIEESPEMAAVAREHIAGENWWNVTVVQAAAEKVEIEETADAALFCAVHDIMQSPGALQNVLARLGPGAPVAAGGGKWAGPLLVAVNSMIRALHAPYVRDFAGFDRPWRHLEQLLEDVQVREMAFGAGYVMTGHTACLTKCRLVADDGRPHGGWEPDFCNTDTASTAIRATGTGRSVVKPGFHHPRT